jgi:hypothetical protein
VISKKEQWSVDRKSLQALYMKLDVSRHVYKKFDERLYHSMTQRERSTGYSSFAFYAFICTIALFAPFLLYTSGGTVLKKLHLSKSKAKFSLFWSLASLSHIFHVYMILKILISTCYKFETTSVHGANCRGGGLVVAYVIIMSATVTLLHYQHIKWPVPKAFSIITRCCGKKQDQFIAIIFLWSIYGSTVSLMVCAPYQVLLLSANPHLHGFTMLTI